MRVIACWFRYRKRYQYFAGLFRATFGKEPPRPLVWEFEK
jgi:hypothetical protein